MEIRKAYLHQVRITHPDRLDRNKQPAEWEQANAGLRELNEAYRLLLDGSDLALDDAEAADVHEEAREEAPNRPASRPATNYSKAFGFGSVLRLQKDRLGVEVRKQLKHFESDPISENHVALPTVNEGQFAWWLLTATSMSGVLLWLTLLPRWSGDIYLVVVPVAAIAATSLVMGVQRLASFLRWRNAPGVVATRLYCVRMREDQLWVWSLRDLLDVSLDSRGGLASRKRAVVRLHFARQSVRLRLRNKQDAKVLIDMLGLWRQTWQQAADRNDSAYFLANEDLLPLRRERRRPTGDHHHVSPVMVMMRAAMALLITAAMLWSGRGFNRERDDVASWATAQKQSSVAGYRTYIDDHPKGSWRPAAIRQVNALYDATARHYRETLPLNADPAMVTLVLNALQEARDYGDTKIHVFFNSSNRIPLGDEDWLATRMPSAAVASFGNAFSTENMQAQEQYFVEALSKVFAAKIPRDQLEIQGAGADRMSARFSIFYTIGFSQSYYTMQRANSSGSKVNVVFPAVQLDWRFRGNRATDSEVNFESVSKPTPKLAQEATVLQSESAVYAAMNRIAFGQMVEDFAMRLGLVSEANAPEQKVFK